MQYAKKISTNFFLKNYLQYRLFTVFIRKRIFMISHFRNYKSIRL